MMFNRIPPVGNPIRWRGRTTAPQLCSGREQCQFLNSGTAALAAALQIARKASQQRKPEVIMPGYACPDLITAAVYAGVTPVLVDLDADSPYLSLQAISEAITENTIAITALNFLGISERIKEIRTLIGERNILIIEDSAQWFPEGDEKQPPQAISSNYNGDLVVLSFGKGKPISLLGGGALIIKKTALLPYIEAIPTASSSAIKQCTQQLLPFIYNRLISPYGYWLLEALPFIELGKTEFKTLETIAALDLQKLALLASNIKNHQQRDTKAQRQLSEISEISTNCDQLIDLAKTCSTYNNQRLLRYPLLLPNQQARDTLLKKLTQAGCGASPLYQTILPNIAGVSAQLKNTPSLPNADNFAQRLITLPTHQNVNKKHIKIIEHLMNE